MRALLGFLLFFSLLGVDPSSARAHPMVKRGVVLYEEADFQRALETFDAASKNADLSVEELLELFEMRALVHHALGDTRAMRKDLRRIAAVRPSYQLSRLAPPAVRTAFDEVQTKSPKVELRIEEKTERDKRFMVARVVHVPDDLVDHVTLTCLLGPGDTAVSLTSQGAETQVPLPQRGRPNGCDATARTRQGGVLFRAILGKTRPSLRAEQGVFQKPEYVALSESKADKKRKRWPWFVAAAAVVVAGGVTAGVVLSKRSSSEPATLGGATVSW